MVMLVRTETSARRSTTTSAAPTTAMVAINTRALGVMAAGAVAARTGALFLSVFISRSFAGLCGDDERPGCW